MVIGLKQDIVDSKMQDAFDDLRKTIFSFQIQEENYELLPSPGNALLLQRQKINTVSLSNLSLHYSLKGRTSN